MADASFTDLQYQMMRVYNNRNYIADLAFGMDSFMGRLKKRKTGGQADVTAVSFDGAGNPSNVDGIAGVTVPSQGGQFNVTPVPMTNLMGLTALAALAGSNVGGLVKPLKRELDQAIKKVGKVASIEIWSDGFPSIGTVPTAAASTTLTLGDPDDAVKFSKGDRLVFAAARTSGALRAGVLTVNKVNQNSGTLVVDANVSTVASNGDFIFLENTRNTAATKIGITGITGWLPATGGTLFGLDTTVDDRLIGMRVASTLNDIEGAFIDGIAQCLIFSEKGCTDLESWMHPRTWAVLAKAMQSKTVTISPITEKAREGDIAFSGWNVSTPNGTVKVFTSRFCPKATIFMLNMSTWELLGWGMDFPAIVANKLNAGPPIFFDPNTGSIRAMVGGFPQLVCNAPGWNLTITLS